MIQLTAPGQLYLEPCRGWKRHLDKFKVAFISSLGLIDGAKLTQCALFDTVQEAYFIFDMDVDDNFAVFGAYLIDHNNNWIAPQLLQEPQFVQQGSTFKYVVSLKRVSACK